MSVATRTRMQTHDDTAATESSPQPRGIGTARVAVVIPFFNQIDKLRRAVESLIAQELRPALVVFVDDKGAERMEPGIIRSLEEVGIATRLVVNEQNMGPGRSRQAGFSQVPPDTDYVLFLDSDDYVSEGFLASSVRMHAARPDIIATYGDSVNSLTGESRVEAARIPENLLDGIVNMRPWGTGALLWNHRQIKDVEWTSWKNIEDTYFELSAAMVNPRVAFVSDATLFIDQDFTEERLKARNRTYVRQENFENRRRVFETVLRDFPFERHGVRSSRYLALAAYHLSFFYLDGPLSYFSTLGGLLSNGRFRAAWEMAYRFPNYLTYRRRHLRKGSHSPSHS
jgi:glycosyltransferase involved in cell wall biosynthesis